MISIVRCARSARTRLDPASASTSKVHRVLAAKRLRLAAFSVARIRPGIRAPCGLAMLAFRGAKTSPTSLAEALNTEIGQHAAEVGRDLVHGRDRPAIVHPGWADNAEGPQGIVYGPVRRRDHGAELHLL